MKRELKIHRYFIGIFCVFSLLALAQNPLAQEEPMIMTIKDFSFTINVPDVGPILGTVDLEVSHPSWISARPADAPPRDPTDPANVAEAWLSTTFTNIRDLNGEVVAGATLHQEWVGVSIEEGHSLMDAGFAIIGSSGGFVLALIKQEASPEATAAFGIQSIDNGEFIRGEDTVETICG